MTELEALALPSRCSSNYRIKSLTAGLSALQVIFFLVSLMLGMKGFGPDPCSLYQLGGLFAADIEYRWELHRLVLPALLHANILHLVVNLTFQLQVGFALERHYGLIRFSLIYILSEIAGNLYAARFDSYSVIVGATTGLLGLMGSQVAIFAYNWKNEDITRLDSLTIYGASVFVAFALSSLWSNCTRIGHIASFCYGGMLGFVMQGNNTWKGWALRLLAVAGLLGATYWILRQIIRSRQFYDCTYLQYLTSNGEVQTAGDYCELMCRDF
jgi:membrane associated rhomboid family serine protease